MHAGAGQQAGKIGRAGKVVSDAGEALPSVTLRKLDAAVAGIDLGHRGIIFLAKPHAGGGHCCNAAAAIGALNLSALAMSRTMPRSFSQMSTCECGV